MTLHVPFETSETYSRYT